jgi:hypothetical protein
VDFRSALKTARANVSTPKPPSTSSRRDTLHSAPSPARAQSAFAIRTHSKADASAKGVPSYSVQYVGLAQGDFGVLSKRVPLTPSIVPPSTAAEGDEGEPASSKEKETFNVSSLSQALRISSPRAGSSSPNPNPSKLAPKPSQSGPAMLQDGKSASSTGDNDDAAAHPTTPRSEAFAAVDHRSAHSAPWVPHAQFVSHPLGMSGESLLWRGGGEGGGEADEEEDVAMMHDFQRSPPSRQGSSARQRGSRGSILTASPAMPLSYQPIKALPLRNALKPSRRWPYRGMHAGEKVRPSPPPRVQSGNMRRPATTMLTSPCQKTVHNPVNEWKDDLKRREPLRIHAPDSEPYLQLLMLRKQLMEIPTSAE